MGYSFPEPLKTLLAALVLFTLALCARILYEQHGRHEIVSIVTKGV